MDRVVASHAGSRGFDSHRGHMSERFFWINNPGYPHPVSSELENRSIRVAVGDCSVTERRQWRPPYQTGKTACARKTLQTQWGWTHGAKCVRQWFRTAEPLGERRYENWNTHTHTEIRGDHYVPWVPGHLRNRITNYKFGRTHGASYRGYGYVLLKFGGRRGGGGTSLGEWEHNK